MWNGTMWCGTTRFLDPHTSQHGCSFKWAFLSAFQAEERGIERASISSGDSPNSIRRNFNMSYLLIWKETSS